MACHLCHLADYPARRPFRKTPATPERGRIRRRTTGSDQRETPGRVHSRTPATCFRVESRSLAEPKPDRRCPAGDSVTSAVANLENLPRRWRSIGPWLGATPRRRRGQLLTRTSALPDRG